LLDEKFVYDKSLQRFGAQGIKGFGDGSGKLGDIGAVFILLHVFFESLYLPLNPAEMINALLSPFFDMVRHFHNFVR
jgi:hypothetical protein